MFFYVLSYQRWHYFEGLVCTSGLCLCRYACTCAMEGLPMVCVFPDLLNLSVPDGGGGLFVFNVNIGYALYINYLLETSAQIRRKYFFVLVITRSMSHLLRATAKTQLNPKGMTGNDEIINI